MYYSNYKKILIVNYIITENRSGSIWTQFGESLGRLITKGHGENYEGDGEW
jgi:hypothetical protein